MIGRGVAARGGGWRWRWRCGVAWRPCACPFVRQGCVRCVHCLLGLQARAVRTLAVCGMCGLLTVVIRGRRWVRVVCGRWRVGCGSLRWHVRRGARRDHCWFGGGVCAWWWRGCSGVLCGGTVAPIERSASVEVVAVGCRRLLTAAIAFGAQVGVALLRRARGVGAVGRRASAAAVGRGLRRVCDWLLRASSRHRRP